MRLLLGSLCTIVIAAGLPAQQPRPLPVPTGSHLVGTSVDYWTDASRKSARFPYGRPLTIQVWYPAQRVSRRVAPYLFEAHLDSVLLAQQYYGVDRATIVAWATLDTHASLDAPVAVGRYPLVAFSVGLGVIRANYTSLATELASHGYVVMLVESALQGYMRLPDGREVADTADTYGTPDGHRAGVEEWSRDMSWATAVLQSTRKGVFGDIGHAVDWNRLAAAGHSSGGIVALATCERDPRFRACIDLDGGPTGPAGEPMAEFVRRGYTRPALVIRSQPLYDDTTFARRGITRQQWEDGARRARLASDSLIARSAARPTIVSIAGTGHFSFSDGPFVMPTTITRFGGRIIEPLRGWTIITTLMRAYFDEKLAGSAASFTAATARYPEVQNR